MTELRERLDRTGALARVRWCEGRALSYETASAYTPVKGILGGLAGIRADDSPGEAWRDLAELVRRALPDRLPEVAPFLGVLIGAELPAEHADRIAYLAPPQLREAIFRSAIELIAALASERPLVLVFEDLHWADSASIDLVLELLNVAERSTLLLLLVFRPNRGDGSWRVHETAEREHPHLYRAITLMPLADDETRELVASLLAVDGLSEPVRDLILQKSEGNPYFVEEVIRSLIDRGVLHREGERWVATALVANVAVPDTLTAVLTTRLDQLEERARGVAQAASVIGREFHHDELAAVLGDVSELDDALLDLQRRELVREVARVPKRSYRFKHALLQEAAYETVLLRRRVQLHATIAAHLERLQPERVEDIADHYVRARQPERAAPFLVAAGERAARAYATPEAIERLERALELLGEDADAALVRRALEALGEARQLAFDLPAASAAFERLRGEGERRGDVPMRVSGMTKLAFLRGSFFDERIEALSDLAEAERMARASNDGEGLIASCMV